MKTWLWLAVAGLCLGASALPARAEENCSEEKDQCEQSQDSSAKAILSELRCLANKARGVTETVRKEVLERDRNAVDKIVKAGKEPVSGLNLADGEPAADKRPDLKARDAETAEKVKNGCKSGEPDLKEATKNFTCSRSSLQKLEERLKSVEERLKGNLQREETGEQAATRMEQYNAAAAAAGEGTPDQLANDRRNASTWRGRLARFKSDDQKAQDLLDKLRTSIGDIRKSFENGGTVAKAHTQSRAVYKKDGNEPGAGDVTPCTGDKDAFDGKVNVSEKLDLTRGESYREADGTIKTAMKSFERDPEITGQSQAEASRNMETEGQKLQKLAELSGQYLSEPEIATP